MPGVVNGCGTWYYGKSNVERYQGTCSACGHTTTLTSYDTGYFVVVVFVPVIPLGRKRIIEECEACQRHRVMPLKQWRLAQQRGREALVAYRQSPSDPQAAEEALRACAGYRNLNAFSELAPQIEKNLGGNVRSLCQLASVYDVFGQMTHEERVLRKAIEVDPNDDDPREQLADCLIRQGKLGEAEQFVEHIVTKGIPDRVNLLYLLAQGYQFKGEHEQALRMFEACEMINPGIAEDKTYAKLKAASEKNRGKRTPVHSGKFVERQRNIAGLKKLLKVVAIVLVVGAVVYTSIALFQGMSHKVHLVNGLGRAYTAKINGKSYALEPMSVLPIRVREGDVMVEVTGDNLSHAQTVSLRTPFFSRPIDGTVFVINPDASALIARTRFFYSPKEWGSGTPPQSTYSAGQVLHEIESVDYAFATPPESLTTEKRNGEVSKTATELVGTDGGASPGMLLMGIEQHLGKETAARVARQRLTFEPQQQGLLYLLSRVMSDREEADFLRAGLARRPIEVDWHREYQEAMERSGREEEIEREYRELLAKDPGDKALMYLAGRSTLDEDKALEIQRRAAAEPDPYPYAVYSLCFYALSTGEFHVAAELGKKLMKSAPQDLGFAYYYQQAMLADGQYRELAADLHTKHEGPIYETVGIYADEIYANMAMGNLEEARSLINSVRVRWQREGWKEEAAQLEADLAYCVRDTKQYSDFARGATGKTLRAAGALTIENVSEAVQVIGEIDEPAGYWHLLTYIVAARQGNRDVASLQLRAAIEAFKKGDRSARVFAAALEGTSPLTTEQILREREAVKVKAAIVTVLGMRYPASRSAYFNMARKLNYDKRFPYLIIEAALNHPSW